MEIKGHPALVTGGGSGMGEATARHLASLGAKVACLDVNMEGANKVAQDIGGVAVECNVADAKSAEAAIKAAADAHGPARILVNCAGIATAARIVNKDGSAHDLDAYSKVIQVNLIGTFNMLRLFAAQCSTTEPLEDGERGVIVNTASVAAFEGQIGQAAYSSSKGGVVGLMLPAARELGRYGIRVLTIAPGYIATPMLQGMPEQVQEALLASSVFPQRFGHPEEFAKLVQHLCENTILNADVIRMDAGTRMPPK